MTHPPTYKCDSYNCDAPAAAMFMAFKEIGRPRCMDHAVGMCQYHYDRACMLHSSGSPPNFLVCGWNVFTLGPDRFWHQTDESVLK